MNDIFDNLRLPMLSPAEDRLQTDLFFGALNFPYDPEGRDEHIREGFAPIHTLNNLREGNSGRTKRRLRMGCDWRNLERAANNYLECQKSPAPKADCIEVGEQPQTSGIRDDLPQFTMMISLQRTSS